MTTAALPQATALHATVAAYRDFLVFELLVSPTRGGEAAMSPGAPEQQVVPNTKERLGVSEEALALLADVRNGETAEGDLSWRAGSEGATFRWVGSPCVIRDPLAGEAACDFSVLDEYVLTPNAPALEACRAIDAYLDA